MPSRGTLGPLPLIVMENWQKHKALSLIYRLYCVTLGKSLSLCKVGTVAVPFT